MTAETTYRIKVWSIHDDPQELDYWSERTWLAIAAQTKDQALVLASSFYDWPARHRTRRDGWDWKMTFAVLEVDTSRWPDRLKPKFPCRILDLEALRLMGWREDGESECAGCGLAAMGMDQYKLRDCGYCSECCTCGDVESM